MLYFPLQWPALHFSRCQNVTKLDTMLWYLIKVSLASSCHIFYLFLNYLFPNSALISAHQMALLGYLLTTLCRGVIRTRVSRVAPDWDL